jgi:vacuolar-type H+-ATPase subunit H
MARTTKTATRESTKKASTGQARKTKSIKSKGKILHSLPQSMENIQVVQQVACVLDELQNRVLDVKAEANRELKKLMKLYESNYKDLEKRVHKVTSEAKKQAQTSMIHILQKWHEHKEKLPKPLINEVEKILAQIGTKVMTKKSPKSSGKSKAPVEKKRTARSTVRKKPVKKSVGMRKPRTSTTDSQKSTTGQLGL